MTTSYRWREYWEKKAEVSDYEFDRGAAPRSRDIELLSAVELREFIGATATDVVFDAGCGAGTGIRLLWSRVNRVVGMDYSASAIARCHRALQVNAISNVDLIRGDVREIPLPASYVDKTLCISVLQYVDDYDVRLALSEFRRVTKPGGMLILHVKNLHSLYLSTLLLAKQAKRVVGRTVKQEYLRSADWYLRELRHAGFEIIAYNSLNLFMLERMPRRLLEYVQRLELIYRDRFPLRTAFVRRLGADFKIRALVTKAQQEG
jgi:ubiquinone/menaquinone biosynthesis C-methylase UbiE